jgi:hypothetical protein
MAAIVKVKINPLGGRVLLTLRAEKAMPIKGVLSSRDVADIEMQESGDPSLVEWLLPPTEGLYVVYGAIVPPNKLWFAPSYVRTIEQGGVPLRSSGNFRNPRRVSTEKHAEGEWIGPPEALKIILRGS